MPKTITIDGWTYEVDHLDPWASLDHLQTLIEVVGPGVGALLGSAQASGADKTEDVEVDLAATAAALTRGFDRRKVRALVEALAGATKASKSGGQPTPLSDIFALHFRGRIHVLVRWLAFALEAEYGGFFAGIKSGAGPLLAAVRSASSRPSTSGVIG